MLSKENESLRGKKNATTSHTLVQKRAKSSLLLKRSEYVTKDGTSTVNSKAKCQLTIHLTKPVLTWSGPLISRQLNLPKTPSGRRKRPGAQSIINRCVR